MTDCLFCKMVSGEIQPNVVFENDQVLAFRDLSPQAPSHILIIPKQHFSSLNDITEEHVNIMGQLTLAAKKIAVSEGFDEAGYRCVMNCNGDGGQSVYHIHMHLLAGRQMVWPPG